jgi:hypothetical protein
MRYIISQMPIAKPSRTKAEYVPQLPCPPCLAIVTASLDQYIGTVLLPAIANTFSFHDGLKPFVDFSLFLQPHYTPFFISEQS